MGKLLLKKGVKAPCKKSFFFANFARIRRFTATRMRRLYNKDQEVKQQGSGGYTTRIRRLLAGFFGIGATIRIGREILCLPYAGFLITSWILLTYSSLDKRVNNFNMLITNCSFTLASPFLWSFHGEKVRQALTNELIGCIKSQGGPSFSHPSALAPSQSELHPKPTPAEDKLLTN